MSADPQQNPEFDEIIPKCIKELDIKFPDYGNSWMRMKSDYWFKRIANEFVEYEKSMTGKSAQRKLLNMINMCAMVWDNLENGRMEHEVKE